MCMCACVCEVEPPTWVGHTHAHPPPPQVCSLTRSTIADRCGVRVGHQIIEINGRSVVNTPHKDIVQTLTTIVGDVSETRYCTM